MTLLLHYKNLYLLWVLIFLGIYLNVHADAAPLRKLQISVSIDLINGL